MEGSDTDEKYNVKQQKVKDSLKNWQKILESQGSIFLGDKMTIYLFGVSNVGKTTTGKLLSEKLGYVFYDMDEEVKRYFGITLEEFVNTGTLEDRDRKRSEVLCRIVLDKHDKVIAVTPISYMNYFYKFLKYKNVLAIELCDTPENIFDRLVFSDENDVVYSDDEYKYAHRHYYLKEIKKDIEYYSNYSFRIVRNKFEMNGDNPETVVNRLINEYGLL